MWCTHQCEYATDVLFKEREMLEALYPALVQHATYFKGGEGIYSFFGRNLHGNSTREVTEYQTIRARVSAQTLSGQKLHKNVDKFIKLVDAFLQDCSKNYFTQSSRSSQSIDYEHSANSAFSA